MLTVSGSLVVGMEISNVDCQNGSLFVGMEILMLIFSGSLVVRRTI